MMARSLDANGAAKVYIVGRRLEKLEQIASQAKHNSIVAVQGDITCKESLSAISSRVKHEVGFVNGVIANSGVMGPTLDDLPKDPLPSLETLHQYLWKTSMSEFNDTYMVNTTAMFYTFLAFLPLLDAGNKHECSPTVSKGIKSQFIATSSMGAYSRRPGAGFAYAGSKAACIHIIKQLATWMVPYGIRANTFAPGIYPSDMSAVGFALLLEDKQLIKISSSRLVQMIRVKKVRYHDM